MAAAAHITPAPLPSLTAALSRRAALFGAVTATGVLASGGAPATALGPVDPIVALRQRWLAAHDHYATADFGIEDEDEVYGHITATERQVVGSRATTVLGVVTALEWVQAEFREHHDGGVLGDELVLALLDSALGVLRMQVA